MVYLLQLYIYYNLLFPSDFALAFQSQAKYITLIGKGSHTPPLSLSSSIFYDDLSDLNGGAFNGEVINGKGDLSSLSPPSTTSTANNNFPRLQTILVSIYSESEILSNNVLQRLSMSGFHNDNDIIQFAKGFIKREEIISQILIQDFGWDVLDAHRARVALVALVCDEYEFDVDGMLLSGKKIESSVAVDSKIATVSALKNDDNRVSAAPSTTAVPNDDGKLEDGEVKPKIIKQAPWKSVLVNDKAVLRRGKADISASVNGAGLNSTISTTKKKDSYNYGLLVASSNVDTDRVAYQNLYSEMEGYWRYMTVPQTSVVADTPIREQTAKVYMVSLCFQFGIICIASELIFNVSYTTATTHLRHMLDCSWDGLSMHVVCYCRRVIMISFLVS